MELLAGFSIESQIYQSLDYIPQKQGMKQCAAHSQKENLEWKTNN